MGGHDMVERWFLGLPLVEESEGEEEGTACASDFSDEEIERMALGLPLVSA